jgi:hypothetical protein
MGNNPVSDAAKAVGNVAAATGKAVGNAAAATGKAVGNAAAATGKAVGDGVAATSKEVWKGTEYVVDKTGVGKVSEAMGLKVEANVFDNGLKGKLDMGIVKHDFHA